MTITEVSEKNLVRESFIVNLTFGSTPVFSSIIIL